MNFIRKHKDYFLLTGISLGILLVIFIIKGIYPFGNNSLIFGDMYEQVTAFYYYFKDSIFGPTSLLINFNAANGLNFFGVFAYYILSPLSLITLITKRSEIYLVVSLIIALKIIICNLTTLYMIKKLFKNTNSLIAIMLALLYGFSAYALNYYQITSWIDIMYLAPLLVVGLVNLFDENNPKLYIIVLTLSIFMSFYISAMVIIFIFLISLIYLLTFKQKEIGKSILSLGISTILSLGASAIVLLPTLSQYLESSRKISFLETLINSKLGPITDKIVLFIFGPIIFISLLLLLKDYKKHKKFLTFYIPTMILLLLPVIVEPINKLLHFGSYYFFTYRFGLLTTLLLIIGAAYYLNNQEIKLINSPIIKKVLSIGVIILSALVIIALTLFRFNLFQKCIELLSLSSSKILILILLAIFGITFIASCIIICLEKGLTKFAIYSLLLLTIINITSNAYIFLGNNYYQKSNNEVYETLNKIYEDKDLYGNFKYKDETDFIIKNSPHITGIPSMDSFNSLTYSNNQDSLKLLGYTSFQSRTHSKGGTLFSDIILGHKYLLNKGAQKEDYILKKQYNNLYMYELNKDISYGYLLNENQSINDINNTFDIQNTIYKAITNTNDLFTVLKNPTLNNITKDVNNYKVINKDNYLEYSININNNSKIYLEILGNVNFYDNKKIFENFDIYLNDTLVKENYPTLNDNGILDLGTYKDTAVKVKIVFKKDCTLSSLNIGVLDLNKLDKFINEYKIDYDLTFKDNKVNIKINSKKEKILFLPLSYSDSYKVVNNNKSTELIKVFDNYIGIRLNEGENNITLTYIPAHLKIATIISILSIALIIILLTTKAYYKLLDLKILQKCAKFIYLGLYLILIITLYILPTLCFLISFIKYIKL